MVELRNQRFHRGADFRVVINPAALRGDFAFDRDFDFEAVPMHFAALMSFGRAGQSLGGFEAEIFCQASAHAKRSFALKNEKRKP